MFSIRISKYLSDLFLAVEQTDSISLARFSDLLYHSCTSRGVFIELRLTSFMISKWYGKSTLFIVSAISGAVY